MAEVDYRQLSDTSLVMPNGQLLNVQRFTVNNQPWVLYPGKTPANGGVPLYVGTDGTNYQFYTYGAEDGYRLYQYHPAPGSPEDEKNLSKSQEVHTRAYGNDKPKKQFGGTMNYTSYLQGGGATPQSASSQISKDQIAEIITAALQGTGEMKQQASEILQSMLQDSSIAPLVEQVMEEMGVPMQKCGGRVKKKALGSKLIKAKKARCGCELKRVGGRLIEVDSCTGLPVHRNGGNVVKLQTTWTTIPTLQMPYNPEAHRDPLLDSIIRTDMARKQAAEQEAEKAQLEREASARAAFDGSFMAGGLNYGKSNPLNLTRTAAQKTNVPSYIITDLSTLRSPSTRNGDSLAENGTQNKVDNKQPQKGTDESTISKPLFTNPNFRSLVQRQEWVKNNKDYLLANGWAEDEINNYRGQTAAINYKLRDAMNAKAAWDAEQEAARQAAVAQRADDQQRQQKFAEEIAPSNHLEKVAIIPPKTPAIVKPQGLQPTAEQIKSDALTAVLGQNISDRRMAKYGKAYDFIKTGANAANMSAADTRRANRLATKMHRLGLMENGGQLNYANYLN